MLEFMSIFCMRPISNEKRQIIIEAKKETRRTRKNNTKLDKKHQPKLHHQNIQTIPNNRQPQTQTLPRKQKQTNQTTKPTNQKQNKTTTRHKPT
jgi:hypothetical protein